MIEATLERSGVADGALVAAVATGVFCRSGCEAAADADRAFDSARDALAAGFRPCRRCRPLRAHQPDPEWLPTLLEDIAADPARRWHDQDLTSRHLDPVEVRRWFVSHYGLTFHAWCRLGRLGRVLREWQTGADTVRAIREQGFESESDFREAFAGVFGHPPNAVDRESCLWLNRIRTPVGPMLAAVGDPGLCLLTFAEHHPLDNALRQMRREFGRVLVPGDHPLAQRVQGELDAYFEGRLRAFTVPARVVGTAFQEQVWAALSSIPYGQTRSYGDIAEALNHPEAMRAVGRAVGDNRIPIVLPCHRVIGRGGELTGYRGGLWRKRYLLALEQSEAFTLA